MTQDLAFPAFSELTFQEEGGCAPHLITRPHVPESSTDASGVTLGPGYDMGGRTAGSVEADLAGVGLTAAEAAVYGTAAGRRGQAARDWVAANPGAATLTLDQCRLLMARIYPDYVARTRAKVEQDWGGRWDALDPRLAEVLVDLRYRGDLLDAGTARPADDRLRAPVAAGDYAGARAVLADLAWWQGCCNLPPASDGGPNRRFVARAAHLPEAPAQAWSWPVDVGAGLAVDAGSVDALLAHVEGGPGGWFPLGRSLVVHGGVHLRPSPDLRGAPVLACAPGTVVAARLASDPALALGPHGGRNLVLTRHSLGGRAWWSLVVHLDAPALAAGDAATDAIAWLRGPDGAIDEALLARLRAGDVVALDRAVAAGDVLGHVGEQGAGDRRQAAVHWEVLADEVLVTGWAATDLTGAPQGDGDALARAVEAATGAAFPRTHGGRLGPADVAAALADPAQTGRLRALAVRAPSAWDQDPAALRAALRAAPPAYGLRDLEAALAPHRWWPEAVAAGAALPASAAPWHHHPVAFVAAGAGVPVGAADTSACPTGVARGLLEGGFFETAKCFLLPDAVPRLRGLARWYAAHPGAEVLVVGHADRAGDAGSNLTLSLERARAIAAFLRDDVDAWLAWYDAAGSKRWGAREDQHMLTLLRDDAGPFFAGPVDGAATATFSAAVERFQRWSNAARGSALAVDGACGPLTRRELVATYQGADETTLPPGTSVLAFGCGEHFPAVATADGVAEAANRRVDVLFFPDGVALRPPGDLATGPEDPHYPAWLAAISEEIPLDGDPGAGDDFALVVVVDAAGAPVADLALRVLHPDGHEEVHVTDAQGELRLPGATGDPFEVRGVADGLGAVIAYGGP